MEDLYQSHPRNRQEEEEIKVELAVIERHREGARPNAVVNINDFDLIIP